MRHLMILAGAAAMAAAMPALAEGPGKGKGQRAHGHDCPPGLAKKNPRCLPPGQAKKIYGVGERLPAGYRYVPVPDRYHSRIPGYDPDAYRYYYDEERVYVVDPATSLIRSIIDLLD